MLNPLITGTVAAIAAALLGVGWQLLTRHGVTTTLGPLDLAWLRYGVPALVLLPLELCAPPPAALPVVVLPETVELPLVACWVTRFLAITLLLLIMFVWLDCW